MVSNLFLRFLKKNLSNLFLLDCLLFEINRQEKKTNHRLLTFKDLLLIQEMARSDSENGAITYETYMDCFRSVHPLV